MMLKNPSLLVLLMKAAAGRGKNEESRFSQRRQDRREENTE
jgi:hypothetical protein